MSQKILIAALFIFYSLNALCSENIVGKYQHNKEVMVMTESRESCESDGGNWQIDEEYCFFSAADEARIITKKGQLQLNVSTIGSNYHTCEFEGPATLKNNTIISRVVAEEYDSKKDRMVKVICEIRAKIIKNVMSITNNNHCQSFCGANAWLEASDLKKVK